MKSPNIRALASWYAAAFSSLVIALSPPWASPAFLELLPLLSSELSEPLSDGERLLMILTASWAFGGGVSAVFDAAISDNRTGGLHNTR